MKPILFLFFLASWLLSFSQNTESEILSLSQKKVKWQKENNLDSLSMLFDDKIILQHGNGNIQTKSEYFQSLKSGMISYKSVELIESNTTVFGSTAIIMGKVDFVILFNKEERKYNFLFTEVYTKQAGAWKIILNSFRPFQQN